MYLLLLLVVFVAVEPGNMSSETLDPWQEETEAKGPSLLDDLIETSASAYHHRVTILQIEMQKLVNALVEKIRKQCDAYLSKYSHTIHQREQAISAFQLKVNREIAELRKYCRMQIACEQKIWEERDAKIRDFVTV